MRRSILAFAILVSISFTAFAQQGNDPASKAAKLKATLSLTDDQTTKVTAIYQAESVSLDSLRKTDKGDYGAMMKKMVPVLNTANQKILAILTPAQTPVFQAQVDAQNAYIKKMMDGGQ